MKYPILNGREIVPVRLIPLIQNAWLRQVTLAGILANKVKISGWTYPSLDEQFEVDVYDEATGCTERKTTTRAGLIDRKSYENNVHAYHVNDDGFPVKMKISEWEAIYREISLIEPVLRKKEEKNGVVDSMEAKWKQKTIKTLPSGVFLWRDDFDSLWKAHISTFSSDTTYDPPDFRYLNHDVYIQPKLLKLVWEGFEYLRPSEMKEPERTQFVHPATVSNDVNVSIINMIGLAGHSYNNAQIEDFHPAIMHDGPAIIQDSSCKNAQIEDSHPTIMPDEPTIVQDTTDRADLFNRKGKAVPIGKRRRTSSFSDVIAHIFNLCKKTGKDYLYNPDEFMKFTKELIKEGKNQDDYIAERVSNVRCGQGGFFEMQDGHGRTKPKKGIDPFKYPRSEIQKKLSELRRNVA